MHRHHSSQQQQPRPSRHRSSAPSVTPAAAPLPSSSLSAITRRFKDEQQHDHQQQVVVLVLSQIYARAERLRVQNAPHNTAAPITLIELIEASYAVFERYGVGPLEDAEYHRYLLSLSIDPERDWQKKIRRFTLKDQPRIKRQYQLGRDNREPSASDGANAGVALSPPIARIKGQSRRSSIRNVSDHCQHQSQGSDSSTRQQHQHHKQHSVSERDTTDDDGTLRRPPGAVVKPLAMVMPTPPRSPTRPSPFKTDVRSSSRLPLSPSPPQTDRHPSQRRDQFSDMLAFTPGRSSRHSDRETRQMLKENVVRNAEALSPPATRQADENYFESPTTAYKSLKHELLLSRLKSPATRSFDETMEDLTLVEQHGVDDNDDGGNTKSQADLDREYLDEDDGGESFEGESSKSLRNRSAPTYLGTNSRILTAIQNAEFKTLANTFENWKAIHAMSRIKKQNKLQELRVRRAPMPAICTYAFFHWILVTLPKVHVFETSCKALPTTVLRRISAILSADRLTTIRFFTKRLMRWKLEKIFDAWCSDTKKKKLFYLEMRIRRRTEVLNTAFACLQQWTLYKEIQKCLHEKRSWITQRHDRGNMRACLLHWRTCMHNVQSLQAATRHYNQRLLQGAFEEWKQSVATDQVVLRFYVRASKSRAMTRWKQRVVSRRASNLKAQSAERHHQTRLLKHYWRNWRVQTQRIRKHSTKLAYWHRKSSKRDTLRVFQGWKSFISRKQALRQLETQFRHRKSRRTISKVFSEWAIWCERKRMNTLAVIDAVERLEDKFVAKVFKHWKLYFIASQDHDQVIAIQVQRIEKQNLWNVWRRAMQVRRITNLLLNAYNDHLRDHFVSLWKAFVQNQQRTIEITADLRQKRTWRILSLCWQAFQSNLQAKRTQKSSAAKLVSQKSLAKVSDHFHTWRWLVQARVEYNHKSFRVKNVIVRKALLLRTWKTWRSGFQETHRLQLADSLVENLYRRRFFSSWQRFRSCKQQTRAKFDRIVKKLELRRLTRVVGKWKAVLRAKKKLLARQQLCAKNQSTACLDKSWSVWRRLFLRNLKQQSQVSAVISRWQNQRVQISFLKWKTRWRLRRDHRRLVAKMLVANKEKSSEVYCHAWKKLWVAKRKQDIAAQDAVDELSYKRLHRALRSQLSKAVAKLCSRALRSKQLKKIHSTVALLSQQGSLAVFFTSWKNFLNSQRKRRAQYKENLRRLKLLSLQKCIKRWENRVRLRKLLKKTFRKAVKFSNCTLFQQTLAAWTLFLEKRRFHRQLKQKAVVSRVFSLLLRHFQHWQRFTNSKRRRRTLLMRASGMLCHQRESRAFLAWKLFATDAKHTRVAVSKWKNHTLSHYFSELVHFCAICKHKRRNSDRATTFHRIRASGKALRAWRKAARCSKLRRHFSEVWRSHDTRKAFDAWTHNMHIKQAARQTLSRIRNALVLRVFNSWKERIHHELHQMQRIRLRFAVLCETDLAVKTWMVWKAFARQRVRVKAKQRQQDRKCSRLALIAWRGFASYRRSLKDKAKQFRAHTEAQTVLSFWAHWRWHLQRRHALDVLRKGVLFKRQNANVQSIVTRWKLFTNRSRQIKQRMHDKQRGWLMTVFHHGWCQYVIDKREEKLQVGQLKNVHAAFLNEWLTQEIDDRMTKVSICEDVKRASCLKKLLARAWQAWTLFHEGKKQQQVEVNRFHRLVEAAQSSSSSSSLLDEVVFKQMLQRMLRQEREQTLMALEKWQTTQISTFFSHWRAATASNKQQKLVASFYAVSKITRCWRKWRQFMKNALQKKISSLKASNWRSQRACQLYFSTWKHLSLQTRTQRNLVLQAYTLSCVKLVRALFGVWKRFAVTRRTKRVQNTVTQAMYEARLARSTWQTWRAFTFLMQFHRKQLQANTERLQVLLLCSSFRGWQAWATQKKKMMMIARTLSSKCGAKTARLVLLAWHEFTHSKLTCEHTVLAFRNVKALQKGVLALKQFAARKKHNCAAVSKAKLFFAMMRSQQVASQFLRWHQSAVASRKKKLATRHFEHNKLLPKAWSAWKFAVQQRKIGADRIAKAALAWKNAFLQKAWNALVVYHNLSKRGHENLVHAEAHHITRALRGAIRDWRQTVSHARHVQVVGCQLLTRWRLRAVYRCFASWNSVTRYQKELRRCQLVVTETSSALLKLQTWSFWRKLFVVERTGKRKCIQRFWTSWREFCDDKLMLVCFQQAIEATYLQSTQKHMLKLWKRFVVESKMRKAMTLLSIGFASTQVAKRSFDNWRKFVTKNRIDKHKIKAVLVRMQFSSQYKVLHSFRVFAVAQKRKRKLVERANDFHATQLQLLCFCEWRLWVATCRSHREKLARYVNVLRHSVQRKMFSSWQEFAADRKQLKLKIVKALALHSQLSSRVVWNALVKHTRKCKQDRLANQFCDAHIAKRSLQQWRKFVVLFKIEQMLGASNKRNIEACFVAWQKHVVLHRNARDFQHKLQLKQSLDQVRDCFQNWRHWSSIQRRFRQILCSAANSNHLRFRFLLWKQFASHRKRLKRMLVVPLTLVQANSAVAPPQSFLSRELSEGSARLSLSQLEALPDQDGGEEPSNDRLQAEEDARLVSIAVALAQKARFFQRFEIEWDLETSWQQWRHIFHARLFNRMRKLHAHFTIWRSWSDRSRRIRWVVHKLQEKRSALSIANVFHGWKHVVQSVKKLQQQRIRDRELWTIVNTEMIRKERKCAKNHWRAWKFYVEEKRHLRTSLEMYHRARIMTKYWLVWTHDFMRSVRHTRAKSQHEQQHMTKFYKRRALQSLQINQQWRKRARLVLEYFSNRNYDTTLPQVLKHWRSLVKKSKRVRKLCKAMQWRWLIRAFHTWNDWKHDQRTRKTRVLALMSRSRQATLDSMWLRWRQFAAKRLAKTDVCTKCTRHYLARRLRKRWYQRIQDREIVELKIAQASKALLTHKLRKSVHHWRNHSTATKLRRLYRTFSLRKHLTLWRWNVKQAIACRFEHFLLRAHVKKMLCSWRQVTSKFQYWRQLCADMIREQDTRRRTKSSREEQLEIAERHRDSKLRRKFWSSWRTAMQAQQKRRFSLLSCMVKLTSLSNKWMLEVVWRSWRRWADRERRSRALQSDIECNFQKKVLCAWRSSVEKKQQSRQRRAQAESYHSNRLVSASFFYWQNYALAWKDVTDANRGTQSPPSPMIAAVVVCEEIGARVDDEGDQDAVSTRVRLLSPVMKRMRQKNQAGNFVEAFEDGSHARHESCMPSFSEAAELSIDVKKRLMVLGKWNPRQKSLQSPRK